MHIKVNITIRTTHTDTDTHTLSSPKDGQTLCPDVLAAMLDTGYQVRYKLVDGAFILDRARHTLGYLHLVALTVETRSIFL